MNRNKLTCKCGHWREMHEHWRVGTDCGWCGFSCPRFRFSLSRTLMTWWRTR